MCMAEREQQALVEARHRNEIETVVEDKAAQRFVLRLTRRDLGNPRGLVALHARCQRMPLLRCPANRHVDETHWNLMPLQHTLHLGDRTGALDLPTGLREKLGDALVVRGRKIQRCARHST